MKNEDLVIQATLAAIGDKKRIYMYLLSLVAYLILVRYGPSSPLILISSIKEVLDLSQFCTYLHAPEQYILVCYTLCWIGNQFLQM